MELKRFVKIFLILTVSVLLLSACSGLEDDSNQPQTPPTTAVTEVDLTTNGITFDLDLSKSVNLLDTSNLTGKVVKVYSDENSKKDVSYQNGKLSLSKSIVKSLLGEEKYSESTTVYFMTDKNYLYKLNVAIATKIISYPSDLKSLYSTENYLDAYFILDSDIDCDDLFDVYTFDSLIFLPISNWNPVTYDKTIGFDGIFDGRGHVIENLSTYNRYNNLGGIFGQILEHAVIKNVAFVNCYCNQYSPFTGESSGFYGKLENVFISLSDTSPAQNFLWRVETGCTLKNVIAVGFEDFCFSYSDGNIQNVLGVISKSPRTHNNLEYTRYDSVLKMKSGLTADNIISSWTESKFTFDEQKGSLLFNGKAVL